nr:MAG TPA: hypothetical protein [Crassvirales sp.]
MRLHIMYNYMRGISILVTYSSFCIYIFGIKL